MSDLNEIRELEKSVFNTLYAIDTRERSVEKDTGKNKLNYLPWAVTYSEVCKRFDDVSYKFLRHHISRTVTRTRSINELETETTTDTYDIELPYFETPAGIEVRTEVTINGVTKEMCLPVYNDTYKSMSFEPYTYATKYGDKEVKAAKLDDIYKSLMRCFAKNLSMWGVGINLWTKEETSEIVLEANKLQQECFELIQKKSALSAATQEKVSEICKTLVPDANGDPRLCDDNEVLKTLKKELLKIRKIADK